MTGRDGDGRCPRALRPLAVPAAAAPRGVRPAVAVGAGLGRLGTSTGWRAARRGRADGVVLVARRRRRAAEEFSPPAVSVRSRVHEYGGGAYCLVPAGGPHPAVAYVDQADQRVWLAPGGGPPPDGPPPARGRSACRRRRAWPGTTGTCGRRPAAGGCSPCARSTAPARWPAPWWPTPCRRGTARARRPGRSGPCSCPGGTSTPRRGRPRTAGAWPGSAGTTRTCRGTRRSCGWDRSTSTPAGRRRAAAAAWPAAPARRAEVSAGQPLWCADGSLAFVADPGGWWLPWRWPGPGGPAVALCHEEAEYHGPDWALGQATMAELPGGTLACRRRRDGTDVGGPAAARRRGPVEPLEQPCVERRRRCAPTAAARRGSGSTPLAPPGPWWWPGEAAGSPAARPRPRPPAACSPRRTSRSAEPFSRGGARGGPVHGLYYRAGALGHRGPRRRRAAARGPVPRRPHRQRRRRLRPDGAVLHHPGLRRGRRRLRRQHRLRAGLPATASRGVGRGRRGRLRGRRPPPGRRRPGRRGPHGRPGQQRRRLDGARRPGPLGRVRRRRVAGTGSPTCWPWPRPPTTSRPTTPTGWWARCPAAAEPSTGAGRRCSGWARSTARCCVLQGHDDPVVPAVQAEAMVAALRARGRRCRVPGVPRRGPRVPPCRDPQARPRGGARLLPGHLVPAGAPVRRSGAWCRERHAW